MASEETIQRVDLRKVFRSEFKKNEKVETSLDRTLQLAAHHGASVLELTGNISTALKSMGFEPTDELKTAVQEVIGPKSVTRETFLDSVLKVVGGGGLTGIPTAKCLHAYLPQDRKPTEQEMEEAWQKCSQMAAARAQ